MSEQDQANIRRRLHKGRGAVSNVEGRFQRWRREAVDDGWAGGDEEIPESAPATVLGVDHSRSVITYNRSPDLGFDRSINPYRGCEHGCIYCYARPSHAYLDLSPGLDFETRIFHKPDAPAQLARELAKRGYRPAPIALGVNTDAWQPLERRLRLTRRILEVLREHRHPVTVITKSALIERDLDLLAAMAAERLVTATVSITTLDDDLNRRLEPRAAGGRRRLRMVAALAEAGVPVGVNVAPVIPALNDREIEAIVAAAAERGAQRASYILLRLPHEVAPLFAEWLETHYPQRAEHVLSLIRQAHGGCQYDSRFGHRMRGSGDYMALIAQRFRMATRRCGLDRPMPALDCSRFRVPVRAGDQMSLL